MTDRNKLIELAERCEREAITYIEFNAGKRELIAHSANLFTCASALRAIAEEWE